MKKSNLNKIAAFLLIFLLLFACLMTTVSAEDSANTPETTQNEDSGEGNIFNRFFQLRENGGIVTEAFGEKVEVTLLDGTKGYAYAMAGVPYALTLLLMAVFSYVIGSLNFGVLVSKKMFGDDVRNHGSGNAGMTNVLRTYGKKAAILTFLGDLLKSSLCAFLGLLLAGNGCGYIAVAFCMIGHAFPVFFKFKGGKAVASTFGGLLVLEPLAAVILFVFFATIILGTKYVSLGSVITAALIPLVVNAMWRIGVMHRMMNFDYFIVVICTVFYACFIIWLHRANLKRLYNGTENKTYFFKKKEKEAK